MAGYFTAATPSYLSAGPVVNIGTDWTFATWLYYDTGTDHGIAGRRNGSAGWAIYQVNDGELSFGFFGTDIYTWTFTSIAFGWHHICVRKSGTTATLYIDGVSKGDKTVGTYNTLASDPLFAGCWRNADLGTPFVDDPNNGRLAEMALWDSALDPSTQINTGLYTGAAAGKAPNAIGTAPAHYWPLDTDATATVGGTNFTNNNVTFTTHATAGLTITGGASGVTKLKLLAHSSAASATGIAGTVFAVPTGGAITGAKIGEFTDATFEASLESGQSVLKVACTEFGGEALTTSDTPVALVRNTTNTTGIVSCTVIEE